jgi:thiamine monophosphate kinase
MQATSDVLLGWYRTNGLDDTPRDFYVRQLWDWKISADIEQMPLSTMRVYGQACGWTLARAHARSGDRIAIAAYLGSGQQFETAIVKFSEAYADQNERDYRHLHAAVEAGRITAEEGL